MKNISIIQLQCTGCRSCEQSCPRRCISLEENAEGFLFPVIMEELCIECGRCLDVCPETQIRETKAAPLATYAFKNRDLKSILKSASGGAGHVGAQVILRRNGTVYGAVYNDDLTVKHVEFTQIEDSERLQSSKYVQSDTAFCYSQVRARLNDKEMVLFTGTPCQVAGLYAFLGEDNDNLYTIDLICHGVPSPKLWRKYIAYQENRIKEKIDHFNFRSKEKYGWGTQYLLETKTKAKTKKLSLDKYGKHFLDGDCYRECCYHCRYANIHRVGDLTIGDYWGIIENHSYFFSRNGVSCVLVNTRKGQALFNEMRREADTIETTLDEAMVKQGNLKGPSRRPKERDAFYKDIENPLFFAHVKVGLQLLKRTEALLPNAMIIRFKRLISMRTVVAEKKR